MKLFESGKIGKVEIKNRIIMAAIGVGGMIEKDGSWGESVYNYYVARANGGTGLITTGLVFVTLKMEPFAKSQLDLYLDSHLKSLRKIVEGVHRSSAKISVQLTAGFGRVAPLRWRSPGVIPISASPVPCYFDPDTIARPISTEEAQELAQAFGAAARCCKMAGVDVIELHGHEGYLLDQFMTSLWNHRNDRYGGSRAKRLTFIKEAIAAIKNEVGDDLPVIYRFGADHYLEGGRTLEESLWIAKQLETMGVAALHIDAGCYETSWWPHPPTYQPRGCMVDLAAEVKRVVKIPVIAVGKLHYPELAERVLQEGKADFIAIGRGLLADPDWPNKVREGCIKDIKPCIGDHEGCSGELRKERPTSCTVNPACGYEKELTIIPIKHKKSLLVIGGGPAGMEAARVGALRGMDVILWEKLDRLGGNLWPASVPEFKKDLRDLIYYQANQLKKGRVETELNREATEHDIVRFGADYVIVATGAYQEIPYLFKENSILAMTASDILLNKSKVGNSILVFGGGLIGCETAVYLAQKGKKVTLASRKNEILAGEIYQNRLLLLKMMEDSNVQVLFNTRLVKVIQDDILLKENNMDRVVHADNLVFGGGMRSHNELQKTLSGKIAQLHCVGDCVEPRRIIHAIWGAYHRVLKLEA